MGKKKTCPKCSQEFEDSKKERLERGAVERMLSMIKVAGLDEVKQETKECCYACWKIAFRSMMKPYAQQLGQSAEGW